MNNSWEYRVEQYLPQILQSKKWIIHAIREYGQFEVNGLTDDQILANVMAYEQKTYKVGRLIGGESLFANEDSLTNSQKIVYESIIVFIVSKFSDSMNHNALEKNKKISEQVQEDKYNRVLIKFNEYIEARKLILNLFIKEKIMNLNWEIASLTQDSEYLNEQHSLLISEDEQMFEELWSQAESMIEQEFPLLTQKHVIEQQVPDSPEKTDPCILLILWEKICEFFVWLREYLYHAVYQSSLSRYSPP